MQLYAPTHIPPQLNSYYEVNVHIILIHMYISLSYLFLYCPTYQLILFFLFYSSPLVCNVIPPPPPWVMGCGAAEATGLGFVCFVVINPCVLSANRVDLVFFCFINFPILLPPPRQNLFKQGKFAFAITEYCKALGQLPRFGAEDYPAFGLLGVW